MGEIDSRVDDQLPESNEEQRLKYLEFLHSASLQAIICFSNLYCYAKDKAGPLKRDVESVEGTIKTVVGPVYHRFHDVPFELIKFVDHKVDESLTKLDHRVPPVVKQLSSRAYGAAQKVPVVARSVASEVQRGSVVDTTSGIAKTVYTKYEPKAKQLYSKYEPVAEQYAVLTWRSLNRLPLFPQVAQVLVPTAAFCSEKYNRTVKAGSERGYRVANYLPLVPTDRIAKVFETRDDDDDTKPVVSGGDATAAAVAVH